MLPKLFQLPWEQIKTLFFTRNDSLNSINQRMNKLISLNQSNFQQFHESFTDNSKFIVTLSFERISDNLIKDIKKKYEGTQIPQKNLTRNFCRSILV